jgi:small ubiquitin-related modifier
LNLKVTTQDGMAIFFKCKFTTTMQKLMTAYANRNGVNLNSIRFLFDGDRIRAHDTPFSLYMEDGDVIDVMMEQVAVPWTHHGTLPITASPVLIGAANPSALSPSEVARMVAEASGPTVTRGHGVVRTCPLLTRAQCAALVARTERAFAAHGDAAASWTLHLSQRECAALIGPTAVACLCALGHDALRESRPWADQRRPTRPAIVVRRRAAAGGVHAIRFHRDVCRVVVHVPLDDGHEGGQLLFALNGRLDAASAVPGVGVAIDNAVTHGVSCVTAGTRHVLLAAFD